MKVLSVALSLFVVAGFIQTAVGWCPDDCAACWLNNNSNGVDIKLICRGDCPDNCPSGYHGMHCANKRRCV